MESKIASAYLDATSQTPEATDRGNVQSRTSYAGLNATPSFLNSGASLASYQSASVDHSTHQCIQCSQCHQCIASSNVDCPDKTHKTPD